MEFAYFISIDFYVLHSSFVPYHAIFLTIDSLILGTHELLFTSTNHQCFVLLIVRITDLEIFQTNSLHFIIGIHIPIIIVIVICIINILVFG